MNPNTAEQPIFNPDRRSLSKSEGLQLLEHSQAFPEAYADTVLAEVHAKKGSYDARKRAIQQGQRAGKLWLKLIEGVTPEKQIEMIGHLDRRINKIHNRLGIPKNGFLAGAKGEFSTGVMLVHSGLEVRYPPDTDDLYNKTDLLAGLPDGRKLRVQSKTIRLPISSGREITKDPLPIFSLLRSEEDLEYFENALNSLPVTEDEDFDRISDILNEAREFRKIALNKGDVPIYCLLDASESEASDIVTATARPTKEAETQGLAELDSIINRV